MKTFSILIFTICFLFINDTTMAQISCPKYYTAGDTANDVLQVFTIDNDGNIYITGWFENSIMIGNQQVQGNSFNLFVAKIDTSNNLSWIKIFFSNSQSGTSYASDLNFTNGSLMLSGTFADSIVIDSYVGKANGGNDIFLAKLDAQTGNCSWLKTGGGPGNDLCTAMTCDKNGNCYIGGTFLLSATFGSTTLTSTGSLASCTVKYDSSGNVVWAHKADTPTIITLTSIAVDRHENVIISGRYKYSVDFGNGAVINTNTINNAFVAKYDSSGIIQWAKDGINPFATAFYNSLKTVDSSDNFYCLRYVLSNPNAEILKFNSLGDTIYSIPVYDNRLIRGYTYHYYLSFLGDKLYFSANYDSKIVIAQDSIISSNPSLLNYFVAEIDTNGVVQNLSGYESDSCLRLELLSIRANENNIYVGGTSSSYIGCTFDSILNIGNRGASDIFVAKLCSPATGLTSLQPFEEFSIYPNPFRNEVNIAFTSKENSWVYITILNTLSENVRTFKAAAQKGYFSATIDLKDFSAGIYFVELITAQSRIIKKIIKY